MNAPHSNVSGTNQPASPDAAVVNPMTPELQGRQMDLDAGMLGRFFGSSKNAALNISGGVAFILLVAGLVVTFWPPKDMQAMEFWKVIVIPPLTVIIGFFFGRSSSHDGK